MSDYITNHPVNDFACNLIHSLWVFFTNIAYILHNYVDVNVIIYMVSLVKVIMYMVSLVMVIIYMVSLVKVIIYIHGKFG